MMKAISSFMRLAFRKAGLEHSLRTVSNGREAIDYLAGNMAYADRARFPLPSVVLLDLNFPLLSGFAVLQWLRDQKQFKSLPVMVFTSSAREESNSGPAPWALTSLWKSPLLRGTHRRGRPETEIAGSFQPLLLNWPTRRFGAGTVQGPDNRNTLNSAPPDRNNHVRLFPAPTAQQLSSPGQRNALGLRPDQTIPALRGHNSVTRPLLRYLLFNSCVRIGNRARNGVSTAAQVSLGARK